MEVIKSRLEYVKDGYESIESAHNYIIADIRNKLSPMKNLVALIENDAPKEYIIKQLEQVKKNIKYLSE